MFWVPWDIPMSRNGAHTASSEPAAIITQKRARLLSGKKRSMSAAATSTQAELNKMQPMLIQIPSLLVMGLPMSSVSYTCNQAEAIQTPSAKSPVTQNTSSMLTCYRCLQLGFLECFCLTQL